MKGRHSNIFVKAISAFAFMLISYSASAQAIYSIKLKLVDDKTSEPVAYATASATVKGETTPEKYVLTDAEGVGNLLKLKKGTYIVKAELMGYESCSKEVVVDKNIDLGTIRMKEDAEVLDAASVSAVGNPILVKKDTIEYTASSFKTSDNDMLEELLKKLPGVEVESDGSITANGETITKITIDGKTFFLDDPQLASKNIPAKMIEKVKVVEKKSDQALFTGIDDGEEEMVIDLSLKPGMMQGWFGNIMGGGGHDIPGANSDMNDWRYQGAAMVGKFTDNSQISLIFNANNTNNRGFRDVAGSMMSTMRGGMGMGRGMGGFGGGNGIANSWMGGLNGAFTLFDGDMELSGNYLYNGSDRFVEEESSKITYLDDGSRLLNDQKGTSRTFTQGHRFGVRLEHDFSKNTSLLFEPQFNFGAGSFNEYSDFQTYTEKDAKRDSTNKGYTSNAGDNNNWSTSGFILLRQRIGKPGRTLSANVRYSFSNNELLGFNQSLTQVKDAAGVWNPEIVNQRYDQSSQSASVNGRLVYTEPITDVFFFEANYNYGWSRNITDKKTYNSGQDIIANGLLEYTPSGEQADSRYSNSILNRSITHRAGFNFRYQKEKIRAQLGLSANPTDTYNETTGHDAYRSKVVNWSPQAMFNYEFSDNSNIRLFYFGRSSQPSTSQLLPVPDNSNPLNISLGNPNLNPYFNHSLRGTFRYTNKETFTSVHTSFGGGMVENAITNAQWYDPSGVQYSIPVNGPATGNVNGRVMVNTPLGDSDFSIFSMTNARYNRSTSYIGTGALDSSKYYDAENASFDYDLFNKDFPDLGKSSLFIENNTQTLSFTERIRITYRNDFVELTAGARTRVNKSWYTMENSDLAATWNNQADFSMNWTIPCGMNIISDFRYNWYEGYTTEQPDEFVLNAEITQTIFKKKCTLAVKAYDILGQSKNLSVSDSANYHMETRNNTLGRYIIVSLTYRFGTFGGQNGGGMRGPGGPMGFR